MARGKEITGRVPPAVYEALRQVAENYCTTMNAVLVAALIEHLENEYGLTVRPPCAQNEGTQVITTWPHLPPTDTPTCGVNEAPDTPPCAQKGGKGVGSLSGDLPEEKEPKDAAPKKPARPKKMFDPETEGWISTTIKASEPYVGHPDGARTILRKIPAIERADFERAHAEWVKTGDDRRFVELIKLGQAGNWRRYLKTGQAAQNNGRPAHLCNPHVEGTAEWWAYRRLHPYPAIAF